MFRLCTFRTHCATVIAATLALAAVAAPTAFAADTDTTQRQTLDLTPIQVVGTRLSAPDLADAGAVITITRADIDASGFTQLGDLLNSLTFSGAAPNTHYNSIGTGRVNANMHNLGANRTLVLVNGQRWVTTVGGPVDLTTIPLAIVQRVEVLLDGASAIYGSDAIAGVINIVTVKNFVGTEAGAQFGGFSNHGFDGKHRGVHFVGGTTSDRLSILFGAGYNSTDPIYAGDRDISRYPLPGFPQKLGSPVTPDGHLILQTNDPGPYAGNCVPGTGSFQFRCDLAGPLTGSGTHPFTTADLYNDAPLNLIDTKQERWHLYSQGRFDLTDNLDFSYMALYERRDATEITPRGGWTIGAQGEVRVDGLPVGVAGTNRYNPLGVDLVPAAPGTSNFTAWCERYGTAPGGGCSADFAVLDLLGIRPLGQKLETFNQRLRTFYFNGGLNGHFELFGSPWHWSTHFAYGQSHENEQQTGFSFAAPIQYGLAGADFCASKPDCVPLDVFHGSRGVTADMLHYINFSPQFKSDLTTRDYNANIEGGFFKGWYAGRWQAAAGYEYLEEEGLFQPDRAVVSGLYVGFPVQPTKGSKSSHSQYLELGMPFAKGLPFAKTISLNLAMRFTQAEWSGQPGARGPTLGGSGHASSGRVGFKWEVNKHLLFRSTWSQGYRVPTISELFSAQSVRPRALIDPCVANQTLPPGQQRDLPNCPGNGHGGAIQPKPTIPVLSGGNPALDPERSQTRTIGMVWNPRFVPGLSFSADYYKIEIVNAVSSIGAQTLLDGCYLESVTSYCAPINRESGIIHKISATRFNAGSLHTNGWDIAAHYQLPETPVGRFKVGFTANFTRFLTECDVVETPSGTASRCTDSAGDVEIGRRSVAAVPKRRMRLQVGWEYGKWAAAWNTYLIGRMYEKCSDSRAATLSAPPWSWCSNNAENTNELGTTVYHDVQASYTVPAWHTTFTLGVNNVFDRAPPIAMTFSPGGFLPVYYRIPGRYLYARVNVRF